LSYATACFPQGTGFSTYMDKVAERSTGQIPRAALHEYLLLKYDSDDKTDVNRRLPFQEFRDSGI
jgi:hypothetical protein